MAKKNLILSLLMFMSIPLAAMSGSDQDGIFDFVPSRDLYAVKSMIDNNLTKLFGFDKDDEEASENFFDRLRSLDSTTNKILTQSYAYDVLFYNLNSDQIFYKVLRKDGKTIGFMNYHVNSMALFQLDCSTWNLEVLVIDEEYCSNGYGSKMLQYLIEDVQACGGDQIITFYDRSNVVIQEFYKKNGFNIDSTIAVKIIDSKDFSEFNEIKAFRVLKSLAKNWFYVLLLNNNFKGQSINLYDYMSSILNQSIENIDSLTREEFYRPGLFNGYSYVTSFDFDNYKTTIKMKLEKIKAALESEGPQREAWSDYINFKIMQSIYYYL